MTMIKGKEAECILNIAEAQFQDVNVVDKEINFMSLIIRLLRILKWKDSKYKITDGMENQIYM